MIGYECGVYDVLRAKDLQQLDKKIQISKLDGATCFGLGVYDENLISNLGISTPLKSLEDRMKIMQQIRGIDFVFPVSTLDKKIIEKRIKEAYKLDNRKGKSQEGKEYDLVYVPGTYDLFHAGHLENLSIASSRSKRVIVGVKADEFVEKQKNRKTVISEDERVEILRHFKFVYDVYKFYTKSLKIANEWVEAKYGKGLEAIFVGSDLREYYNNEELNVIFTNRDEKVMQERSTTAYRKLYLGRETKPQYKGTIAKQNIEKQRRDKDNETKRSNKSEDYTL